MLSAFNIMNTFTDLLIIYILNWIRAGDFFLFPSYIMVSREGRFTNRCCGMTTCMYCLNKQSRIFTVN